MSDTIQITGITGYGYHGVYESERIKGQVFSVDLVLEVELAKACETDDLSKTINYAEVAEIVLKRIVGEPVNLIERLAEIIAQEIISEFAPKAITVTVHKPHALLSLPVNDISVTINRKSQ